MGRCDRKTYFQYAVRPPFSFCKKIIILVTKFSS